jgi:hypothetical protein
MVTPGALQHPEPFVTLYQLSLIRQPPASFISKGLLWATVQKPSGRNKRFFPRGSGKYLMPPTSKQDRMANQTSTALVDSQCTKLNQAAARQAPGYSLDSRFTSIQKGESAIEPPRPFDFENHLN